MLHPLSKLKFEHQPIEGGFLKGLEATDEGNSGAEFGGGPAFNEEAPSAAVNQSEQFPVANMEPISSGKKQFLGGLLKELTCECR